MPVDRRRAISARHGNVTLRARVGGDIDSAFAPEHPDVERFPLARQAALAECIVQPGDMLYVPAGRYHRVRALTFSLSVNRWARAMPLALNGESSLRGATEDTPVA